MRIASIIFVRNEFELLPVWMEYYSQFSDDIYLINPEREDYSDLKKKYGFKEKLFSNHHDLNRGTKELNEFVTELLKKYDWTIFADADEFVVPDPDRFSGIRDFLKFQDKDAVYCTGYDVIETKGEKTLNLEKPVLEQRKKWTRSHPYNKPALLSKPLHYVNGNHYLLEDKYRAKEMGLEMPAFLDKIRDPSLYLIHLKRADQELYKRRRMTGKINMSMWAQGMNKTKDIPERFYVF